MITKDKLIQTVNEFLDDSSVEDAIDCLKLKAKFERDLAQCDCEETVSHQEVKDRMAKVNYIIRFE
jgi:hypothetical protein